MLIGKHIDKREADHEKGIHTLPVIFGENASRWLNIALMLIYYLVVFLLVGTGTLGVWVLLVVLAVPRLVRVLKIYRQPTPSEPPPDFPIWPLWYVAAAFYHNKLAGGLFVLGLILSVGGVSPPFLIRAMGGLLGAPALVWMAWVVWHDTNDR